MKEKMRVLYISYDCVTEPLSRSQVLPYLEGLADKNDLFLLTFNKKNISGEELERTRKRYGLKKIFSLRYHKSPTLIATLFDIICGFLRSYAIVKRYKISFIHARSYEACAIALAVKKTSGVPYIFDMRGFKADERLDSGDWKRSDMPYRIVKFIERPMLRNADSIIVLTHNALRMAEEMSPGSKDKTYVIPTCADTGAFNVSRVCGPGTGTATFAYIGSLGTWYMPSEMLDFFKVAKEMIPEAKFLIVSHSDVSAVKALADDKMIDRSSLEFVSCNHEDVPLYLGRASVSIFFIRPTYSKQASCPTKFAESISMGIPIVANSGIGDIASIVEKNSIGVIVEDFTEPSYRKAVTRLLELLKDGTGLSERCKGLAEREFSLTTGVRRYESIYEKMRT